MPLTHADIALVGEILGCIEAIDRAAATVQRCEGDRAVGRVALDAVRYRVTVIGEAVGSLSPEIREDHPAVPWSDMARLPDLIDDRYDVLDPGLLRATIGEPVKRLGSACRAILGESVRIGEDEP